MLIDGLIIVASDVCRDLVLYDIPRQNPFGELIPLTHQHPALRQIIIATAALHMSNACQRLVVLDVPRHRTSLHGSLFPSSSRILQSISYRDALVAKQRALCFLKSALNHMTSADVDVILAVVLLFIEFELIDSGRDTWRRHINGANTIIETLCRSNVSTQTSMSPLRSCLISNCLVYVKTLDLKYVLYSN